MLSDSLQRTAHGGQLWNVSDEEKALEISTDERNCVPSARWPLKTDP
jgi:hypothetical protein